MTDALFKRLIPVGFVFLVLAQLDFPNNPAQELLDSAFSQLECFLKLMLNLQ